MHNICVRMPLDGTKTPNVLNASSTNCNCERFYASSAKLPLTLPVCGLECRMRIQIHFPGPKCLCKEQKKVINRYNGSFGSISECITYMSNVINH